MADVVVFPDAERVIKDHLDTVLSVTTYLSVPNPRPATFMVVRRVGGPRQNLVVDNAMLTIEGWGTRTVAKDLLARARGEIHAMRGQVLGGTTVYKVTETSGPAFLPDPDSNHARYSMTMQVAMRGAKAA